MPKRRSNDSLKRTSRNFTPRNLILIVVEGKETEVQYLNSFKGELKLPTTKLKIVPSSYGTDPLNVVRYAEDLYKGHIGGEKKANNLKYDEVFCLIDRDQHDLNNYNSAMQKARACGFKLIRSIPCFEVWFLLHFCFSTKPFEKCSDVIEKLKQHMPSYSKSKEAYSFLARHQEYAVQQAQNLVQYHLQNDPDNKFPNPLTDMHLLVTHLIKQKNFQ
jgi:hypothetical protein